MCEAVEIALIWIFGIRAPAGRGSASASYGDVYMYSTSCSAACRAIDMAIPVPVHGGGRAHATEGKANS